MARKEHSDEDVLKLPREIELKLADGDDVASARRSVGMSDATYYNWRKRFGGMGGETLSEKGSKPTFVPSCFAATQVLESGR